jgi:glycerol-3-phosphate dehydrogenase subunit B
LQRQLGQPVFEIPTLPPSVVAMRLFDRLRKHLQESGVEIIWAAPSHDAEVRDGQCRRIGLKSAGGERPLEAKAYVLALEDIVDGALRAGVDSVEDPFFHQVVSKTRVPAERTAESVFDPQPFARFGYRVNQRLQPLAADGRPLAQNVFVAGGAIAGFDPVGTRSRGGLAIASGFKAASEALAA